MAATHQVAIKAGNLARNSRTADRGFKWAHSENTSSLNLIRRAFFFFTSGKHRSLSDRLELV